MASSPSPSPARRLLVRRFAREKEYNDPHGFFRTVPRPHPLAAATESNLDAADDDISRLFLQYSLQFRCRPARREVPGTRGIRPLRAGPRDGDRGADRLFRLDSGSERPDSIRSACGREEPTLRATLDFGFAIVTVGLTAGACLLLLSGITFALSNSLILLALELAVVNGLFDYYTALVRARFHDRLFPSLVLVKNILTFALMGGGAFWFASAKMTLIGGIISLGGSVVGRRAPPFLDPTSDVKLARLPVAKSLMRYGMPIVAANLLYLVNSAGQSLDPRGPLWFLRDRPVFASL